MGPVPFVNPFVDVPPAVIAAAQAASSTPEPHVPPAATTSAVPMATKKGRAARGARGGSVAATAATAAAFDILLVAAQEAADAKLKQRKVLPPRPPRPPPLQQHPLDVAARSNSDPGVVRRPAAAAAAGKAQKKTKKQTATQRSKGRAGKSSLPGGVEDVVVNSRAKSPGRQHQLFKAIEQVDVVTHEVVATFHSQSDAEVSRLRRHPVVGASKKIDARSI